MVRLARFLLLLKRAQRNLEGPGVQSPNEALWSYPMNKFIARFVRDESGVTAMEYGMIAALIAVAILGSLGTFGSQLSRTFSNIATAMSSANTPTAGG
jgi:pilus assembly protein Flp/PilA